MAGRDIIAFQVPSLLKLSDLVRYFESFGDITKAALDEKRRTTKPYINLFISYADRLGASRAIAAGSVDINGTKIRMERSESKMDFGVKDTERFEIRRKADHATSNTNHHSYKRPRITFR